MIKTQCSFYSSSGRQLLGLTEAPSSGGPTFVSTHSLKKKLSDKVQPWAICVCRATGPHTYTHTHTHIPCSLCGGWGKGVLISGDCRASVRRPPLLQTPLCVKVRSEE